MNFNDIWAITGIPVSPFDARDADVQVTGSGGVALVAELGEELVREGRLAVGDIVTIYSGQSELLSPDQGLDPMAADFRIQGYERNDGSHAQFLVVQGPQLHAKLPGLTLEEAVAALTMGTIHRALFTTLNIQPRAAAVRGRRGYRHRLRLPALVAAFRSTALGMVSSATNAASGVRAEGGHAINRKDPRWSEIFTPVPDEPAEWPAWESAGEAFVQEAEQLAGGPLDYVVSHAGETAFSRSFQLLGENGVLPSTAPRPAIASRLWGNPVTLAPRICSPVPACAPATACWWSTVPAPRTVSSTPWRRSHRGGLHPGRPGRRADRHRCPSVSSSAPLASAPA